MASKNLFLNFQKLDLKISKVVLGASLLALIGFAGFAIAQNNEGGPVQVTANEIDVQPQNNMAIFSGNAEVIQDGAVIRSSKFNVYYGAAGTANDGKIDRVVSNTEIFYVSPTEKVRGDRGEYNASTKTITFVGNVILTQGQNVLTGTELTINTVTRASNMKSSNGRVRAVFFPKSEPKSK